MKKAFFDRVQSAVEAAPRAGLYVSCCITLCLCILLTGCDSSRKPSFTATYHAVLLDNNSAYFGKVEAVEKDFLVLKDVFYVQSQTSTDGKQVANTLIKRGREMHGPNRMYITREHIIMIEPVSPDSRIAKLIEQQGEQTKSPQQ